MSDLKIQQTPPDWKARILRLEFTSEIHDGELKALRDRTSAMADSLSNIQRTLAQIRWIAIGAAVALTAKELNLIHALRFLGI